METILSILTKTTDFLAKKGIEKARLEAELLISNLLSCKRLDLYMRFEERLMEDQVSKLREQVKRRGTREPLQYILETIPFGDVYLQTDPRALIPRPETEYLCELVAEHYSNNTPLSILELGTGSGAIAIQVSTLFPCAQVCAVDFSSDALELAQLNIDNQPSALNIKLTQSDWFANVDPKAQYDLVISNPPYLTEKEWEDAQKEVRDFEPKQALTAPNQGLEDLLHIIENAFNRLTPNGLLALETGIAQHTILTQRAENIGYVNIHCKKDHANFPRYFFAQKA